MTFAPEPSSPFLESMLGVPASALPPRLARALALQQRLADVGLYFAPIRHHSPACAFAVRELIQQVQARHVLIEAPASFQRLLSDLNHPDCKPPIAVLCQTTVKSSGTEDATDEENLSRAAFYPFCDYSPEWVAIRQAHSSNADIRCIDLSWSGKVQHELMHSPQHKSDVYNLQAERYLAHSRYIQRLTEKLHCRDYDELWEHLFELRSRESLTDSSHFFKDVLVWCAMARLDYEPEVLISEGSWIREAHMASAIMETIAQQQGSIVIVTGGFHTLALIEELAAQLLNEPSPQPLQDHAPARKLDADDQNWLIRYSFDRLDALNGYASGMPSPAFYQAQWQALNNTTLSVTEARMQVAYSLFSRLAGQMRQAQYDAMPSFITIKTAAEQAHHLAILREHLGAGRFDIMDAAYSCFVKGSTDDGQLAFQHLLDDLLGGYQLGQVPASSMQPPLVNDVFRLAQAHRFKLEDSQIKRAKLDVYRNKKHRERSRFLHLLAFVACPFARHVSGPDFLAGTRLELLFEEWDYAWTPSVEARLIELSAFGQHIKQVALQQLLKMQEAFAQQGQSRSANQVVQLVIQAALMGLQQQLPRLMQQVQHDLPNDPSLSSVIACGQKLLNLWHGRDYLALQQQPELQALLQQVLPTALFLLSSITHPDPEQSNANLVLLLDLHQLSKRIENLFDQRGLLLDFYQQLERLLPALHEVPLILGAVHALQFIDGRLDDNQLNQHLQQQFGIGASPQQAVAYLAGIMQAAPELIQHQQSLTRLLNTLVASWDEQVFVGMLPELRLSFAQLKPKQTAQLAEQLAEWNGLSSSSLLQHATDISQSELLEGTALNAQLIEALQQEGLWQWLAVETAVTHVAEKADNLL